MSHMLKALILFALVGTLQLLPFVNSPANLNAEGKLAFVSERDGNYEIYVMSPDGSGQQRLTINATDDYYPAWSPDGTRIAFTSERNGKPEIYIMNADGSDQKPLLTGSFPALSPGWSSDGKQILFMTHEKKSAIFVINIDGTDLHSLIASEYNDGAAVWSPDGKHIAFVSDENAQCDNLFVADADGSHRRKITFDADTCKGVPAWSPDSKYIVFSVGGRDGIQLRLIDSDGSAERLVSLDSNQPTWSPDGLRLAVVSKYNGDMAIFVMNVDGSKKTRITDAQNFAPSWSR